MTGGELFIVDNSDEAWKDLRYLQEWTEVASAIDIATGYFEIGALLALDGKWQKLDKNTYLKQVRAPVGVKPVLQCWMELNWTRLSPTPFSIMKRP